MTEVNVDRMELRQAFAAHEDAVQARTAAREQAMHEAMAPITAEQDALQQRMRLLADDIAARFPDIDAPAELDSSDLLGWDDDGRPYRCAKSGLVLLDTDEIVEDGASGELFLRAALGLPPREAV